MLPNTKKFPTWWLLIVAGAIFLGIGTLAFIDPFSSYLKLVKFTGVCLLLNGILLLVICVTNTKYPRERKWMQAESVLHLLFAILFLFNPLLTFIALPYFTGTWIFLVGIVKIAAALSMRRIVRGWGFILVVGILCLLFGSLLLFDPFTRSRDVTDLIGLFGVIMGGLYVVDAFRYRKTEDTLDMML